MSEEQPSASGRIRTIGNCEILEKVGQGGMGTVFRARQVSLDRVVALKVLPPSIAKDATFIERFQREARAAAKLNHPHVVNGIDVGQDAGTGLWYFVMEFVDGPTLKDVLQKRTRLPEKEALKLAREVASALDCLAAHHMVHRDIKPDNILLTTRGDAKLADLGLAKDIKDDSSLTQSGRAVGTPYYMSPEQVRGEVADVDIRTDIYALGGTLYHLVTGKPPFSGETSAVIMSKHLTEMPMPANKLCADVSEGCAKLISRMMQKKREERIQNPRELMEAIDKVLSGEYMSTTGPRSPIRTTGPRQPVSGTRGTGRQTPTKTFPLVPVAAAAVLVIGAAAFFVLGGKKGDGTKEPDAVAQNPANPAEKGSASTHAPATEPGKGAKGSVTPPAAVGKTAMGAFTEAAKYAEENPSEYDEIEARMKAVAAKADKASDGPAVKAAVEKALEELSAKRSAVVDAEWQKIEALATVAANGGDIDGALQLNAKLPEAHAEAMRERATAFAERIKAEAEKKINAALARAEEASASAEPQAGLEALAGVDALQYAALAEKTKGMKARLEKEAENVVALKRKKDELAARARLAGYLDRFEKALLDEKSLEQASSVAAEAAKDASLEIIASEAKALGEIVAVHADYHKRTLDALDYHKGKPIKINKDEGTLRETKDGFVSLEIRSPGAGAGTFGIKKIKLADLGEAQRKELFKVEWADTPAAKLASAMSKLRAGSEDLPGVTEQLAGAKEHPLYAVYDERLQIRLKGAGEVAAEKAFAQLEAAAAKPLNSQQEGYELLKTIGEYFKQHGETKFLTEKKAELAAMRAKALKAAIVNVVPNGDFESGEVTGWKMETKGEFGILREIAHTGRFSYRMNDAGRAWTMVAVEPGVPYKLMAFVSGLGMNSLVCRVQEGPDTIPGAVQAVKFTDGEPQGAKVWKPVEIAFTPKTASVMVAFEKEAGSGRSCFDDVVVTRVLGEGLDVAVAAPPKSPVPPPAAATTPMPPTATPPVPPTNLIPNGGFELGTDPWRLVRATLQSDGGAHGGRNYMQVHVKGGMSTMLKTEPGYTYHVSCWVHGRGYLYLQVDKADHGYAYAEEDKGWVRARFKFTASANSHQIEFSPRAATYYIDDVSVVRGELDPAKAAQAQIQLLPEFHYFNGHVYRVFKDTVAWADAKVACEKMGGHLATIENDEENAFLAKLATSAGRDVWIGLYDPRGQNAWVWVDGAKMKYSSFSERGASKRQIPRAVRFAQFVAWDWADDPLDKLYFYVCEWDSVPDKLLAKKPNPPASGTAPQPTPAK